tara:strand:+ start:305 stop:463 length:159 start_codon:yes stop_codon:yes gene_type:complete
MKDSRELWKCYYKHKDCLEVSVMVYAKDVNEAQDISEALISEGWEFDWAEEL